MRGPPLLLVPRSRLSMPIPFPLRSRKAGSASWRKIVISFAGHFGACFLAQPLSIAHVRMATDLGATTDLWTGRRLSCGAQALTAFFLPSPSFPPRAQPPSASFRPSGPSTSMCVLPSVDAPTTATSRWLPFSRLARPEPHPRASLYHCARSFKTSLWRPSTAAPPSWPSAAPPSRWSASLSNT